MRKCRTRLASLAAALALAVSAFSGEARAASPYEGETVTLIVPNSPAGAMSQYARTIAPFLQKHLGAEEVRIENRPGAGGLVGANLIWNADPDGMTIAFASIPTLILAQLASSPGVQFDVTKFTLLGRAASEPRVLTVGAVSDLQSIENVQKLDRPFVYPSQGTDEDFYAMAILADALGVELKIVTGYEGGADTSLAVIKGDGDGQMDSWTGSLPSIQAKDKRPLLTMGEERNPDFPDVPGILEVVDGEKESIARAIINIQETHRGFFGPPDMDEAAVTAMREAIGAAMQDPDLLAEAEKLQLAISFSDGAAEQERVAAVMQSSGEIVPVLEAALASIR